MNKISRKFTISELQSILIFLQDGKSIANLISVIEDKGNKTINPAYRGKFENMLPRLRELPADKEHTLKTFSSCFYANTDPAEILTALQSFYSEKNTITVPTSKRSNLKI